MIDYKQTLGQLWKTLVTNITSAVIDYGVLFLLSEMTGIVSGNGIIPLNAISFTIGTVNSYHFNKKWSFGDDTQFEHGKKFTLFLIVSIIAVVINTTIVRVISTNVHPVLNLSPRAWLFASKVIASIFSFSCNFLGYKFIVFRK
jgi:putative flippase GtrA